MTKLTGTPISILAKQLKLGADHPLWDEVIEVHKDNSIRVKQIKKAKIAMTTASIVLPKVFEAINALNSLIIQKLNRGEELTPEEEKALELGVRALSSLNS